MKELSIRCEDDIVILEINARLDDSLSAAIQEAFDKLHSIEKKKFIFDLEKVDFTTPNGLQMLKECIKKTRKSGGDTKFCNVQSAVQKIFEYTGFGDFSVFCSSESEAVEQLRALEEQPTNKGETFKLLGSPLQNTPYDDTHSHHHHDIHETEPIAVPEDPYEHTVRTDIPENIPSTGEHSGTFRMNESPLQDSDMPYAIKMGEDGSMAIHIAPKEESVISIDGELPPIGPEDIKVLGKYGIAIITSPDNKKAAITHSGVPRQRRSRRKETQESGWYEETSEETSDDPDIKVSQLIKEEQAKKAEEIKAIPQFPEEETDLADAAFQYSGSHSALPSLKSMVKSQPPTMLELGDSKGSASLPGEGYTSSTGGISRSPRKTLQRRSSVEGTEITELHDCSKINYYRQMEPFTNFTTTITLPQEDIRRALNKSQSPQLFVKVTPMIPGCMSVPPYKQVDVACEEFTETSFEITPLATGDYPNAYVEVQYRGKIIEIIKMPLVVKSQVSSKILFGLSIFFLVAFPLADIIKGQSKLAIAITKVFGGLAGFGAFVAVVIAVIAFLVYMEKKPKKH